MYVPYFCPRCRGRFVKIGPGPIFYPVVNAIRLHAYVACCLNCSLVSELDPRSGELLDVRGLFLRDLHEPIEMEDLPPLAPYSLLVAPAGLSYRES